MTQTVRLMSHNPMWRQDFQQARSMLFHATEGWLVDIEHVGGTSLDDGVAQPVIDMLAGIDDLRGLNHASELIEGLNYARLPSPDWCSDELTALLQKPRSGAVTHTVLVARRHGTTWNRMLAIRDWLQTHLGDWQLLQNVKKDNFADGCQAANRYLAAKTEFFAVLEQQISGG